MVIRSTAAFAGSLALLGAAPSVPPLLPAVATVHIKEYRFVPAALTVRATASRSSTTTTTRTP